MSHQAEARVQRLSQSTVYRAIQNIWGSTAGPNTHGFILAFIDDKGVGFNFLTRNLMFSSFLCIAPPGDQSVRRERCAFLRGGYFAQSFAEWFVEAAAQNMRADMNEVIEHYAKRTSEWRFDSWQSGKPMASYDNDLVWRKELWPRVNEITSPTCGGLRCLDTVPTDIRNTLMSKLRGHAVEGMIVLEK